MKCLARMLAAGIGACSLWTLPAADTGFLDRAISVAGSRRMFAALQALRSPAKYSEYSDTRHGPTAERAYAEPDLIPWLLARRRQRPGF